MTAPGAIDASETGHNSLAWLESESVTSVDVESLEQTLREVFSKVPASQPDYSKQDVNLYDALKCIEEASSFRKLLDQCPSITAALQDDSVEHTVWVPSNASIDEFLQQTSNHPLEFIEQILKQNISPHYIPSSQYFHMPNIPVLLSPAKLGGPQVLRIRPSPSGYRINLYAHLLTPDIVTSNGIIHLTSNLIIPPPPILSVLPTLPTEDLATFRRAINLTDLASTLESPSTTSPRLTLFAFTNQAFTALNPSLTTFLLDTAEGTPYLKALLKYHIIPTQTLFSNFLYPKNLSDARLHSSDLKTEPRLLKGKRSLTMPTLLGLNTEYKATLQVTIIRYGGNISMHINPSSPSPSPITSENTSPTQDPSLAAHVTVQDIPASDGVIHIIDRVLIPHGNLAEEEKEEKSTADITIEDFKRRFDGFV